MPLIETNWNNKCRLSRATHTLINICNYAHMFSRKTHMIFKYLKYHKIRPLALYCCICLIVVCPFHCGSRSLSSTLSGFAYSPPPLGLLTPSLFHITRVTTLPLTAFSFVIAFPLPFFLLPATAASVTRCINRNNNS